jgi:hypothetical protein
VHELEDVIGEWCGGRIIEVNPAEEILQAARSARWTTAFKDRYRERAGVERKNVQLKFRTQKIPW